MSTRDKLAGREPLWPGDAWLNMFEGPRLPGPQFWCGLGLGLGVAFLVWWF